MVTHQRELTPQEVDHGHATSFGTQTLWFAECSLRSVHPIRSNSNAWSTTLIVAAQRLARQWRRARWPHRNRESRAPPAWRRTLKTRNRAGQAFRLAAVSVMRADCVFGAFYGRLKSHLGPAQATVATAHFIARVVYRMLKYQVDYEPLSVAEYEKRYHDQQIKYLEKRVAKFGFQLTPVFT
jgi:hypothetical protein